jgi:hypothetical protein
LRGTLLNEIIRQAQIALLDIEPSAKQNQNNRRMRATPSSLFPMGFETRLGTWQNKLSGRMYSCGVTFSKRSLNSMALFMLADCVFEALSVSAKR